MMNVRKHIISGIAGFFTLAQLVLIFFYSVDGISILRIAGFIIWIMSVLFGFIPMFVFKKKGLVPKGKSYIRTTRLVDTGLYGIVRHPQYLAGPLFNMSMMLISQHWMVIAPGIPAIILMAIDIGNADDEGLEKFGKEYAAYMKKVPKIDFVTGMIRLVRRRLRKM